MKRRRAIRNLIVTGAVLYSSLTPGAAPAGDVPDYVIHSDVRLVLLDVSVKSRNAARVTGLSKDDFRIDENGVPQEITVFANKDVPVTVGIVVDNSRSMLPKRAEVLSAATTFIEESNPQDEIFVLNFNETVKRGLPAGMLFSDNIETLRAALASGVPQGRTALNDAVIAGLEQLEQGRRDKKTLILISDGGDNASQHQRREMLDRVERSLATIYTIGLFTPGDQDRDPGILKKLAHMSGGQAYFPDDPTDMTAVCEGIAQDIRTRYTIGYVPPNNGGKERRVHIRVSASGRTGLIARTRPSYRYEQATNSQ